MRGLLLVGYTVVMSLTIPDELLRAARMGAEAVRLERVWYPLGMPVYTARGRLSQGRIVELEKPLPVESAEVEVIISVPYDLPRPDWRETLQHIWGTLDSAGHAPPAAAEVTRTLKALRADRKIYDEDLP